MRVLVLIGLLAATGCASRPAGDYSYSCPNAPDFNVRYTWNPPRARLEQSGHPTIDLRLVPETTPRRGRYVFESDNGVRLVADMPNAAQLYRPGAPTALNCEAEELVLA